MYYFYGTIYYYVFHLLFCIFVHISIVRLEELMKQVHIQALPKTNTYDCLIIKK